MRIWSIAPKYIDSKGLVALWRETLLAKHVLQGKTKGYTHHPQLNRFLKHEAPIDAIDYYLHIVYQEAEARSFHFDRSKFNFVSNIKPLPITRGQLVFETQHLKSKLEKRDNNHLIKFKTIDIFSCHPLFYETDGEVESWEIITRQNKQ